MALNANTLHAEPACDRFCVFERQFGNVYRCMRHVAKPPHICDANCAERLRYDAHSTICRLSRKVFPNAALDAPMDDGTRWVPLPCLALKPFRLGQ